MASKGDDSANLQQLRTENQRLKRAVEELSVLNDLAREIGASINTKEIMDKMIKNALRAVKAEQGIVALVVKRPDDTIKTFARAMVTSSAREPLHLNQSLLGWMYINQKPLIINDLASDERFKGLKPDGSVTSVLCVPLMIKSQVRGVLAVYNKKGGAGFSQEDERLLTILAGQSATIVENARLHEEEQKLTRLEEEVELVSQIQMELLPKSAPDFPGYDIAGINVPARVVGGDYFDFIPVERDKLCVCLGDVSGKGLPASLLMANLQATLRGQIHPGVNPSECVAKSNNMLFRSTNPEHFVTLFCGLLDAKKHEMTFCNAGHNFPFLVSEDEKRLSLETGGVVLGVMENYAFEQECVALREGDVLVIYSDGVTEAMDKDENDFGEERLLELIASHRDVSASALIERIFDKVKEFTGDHPQSDDMTMVVVKRTLGRA